MNYNQEERLVKSAETFANAFAMIAQAFAKIATSYAAKA
jgi:hypothetical protein